MSLKIRKIAKQVPTLGMIKEKINIDIDKLYDPNGIILEIPGQPKHKKKHYSKSKSL
jgi:hypothetical protein